MMVSTPSGIRHNTNENRTLQQDNPSRWRRLDPSISCQDGLLHLVGELQPSPSSEVSQQRLDQPVTK
jgi:hypothetical protein